MSKTPINRQQLALEFISIVFAVLFALFLSSWRENAATARTLDKVKKTIEAEIRDNDQALRVSREYRYALVTDLYNHDHLVMAFPASAFPVDIQKDRALENYLKDVLPFSQATPITRVEVKSLDDSRIVVINERTMKLRIENDTLKFYGPYNLQLRSAEIGNRSWELAKATGTLVEMDLELVDALNKVYTLNSRYLSTSDKAIEMIYSADPAIRSVMEDMYFFENQIIEADSIVLSLLESKK